MHTSELDENRQKKSWNKIPIILGNWQCVNKGSKVVSKFKANKVFPLRGKYFAHESLF